MDKITIVSVEPFQGERVTIQFEKCPTLVEFDRYGPDSWHQHYGCSIEEVYNCAALEAAYQAQRAAA